MSDDRKLDQFRGLIQSEGTTSRTRAQRTKAPTPKANCCDLVIVFDTTVSMSSIIASMISFGKKLVDKSEGLSFNVSFILVSFGDITPPNTDNDAIVVELQLTSDSEKVKNALSNMKRNNGYGNGGETVYEAIVEALKVRTRMGSLKAMLILTDEPALTANFSHSEILSRLRNGNHLVFTVTPDEEYFKKLAHDNAGKWWDIRTNQKRLNQLVDEIVQAISERIDEVFLLAGGDVTKYRQLKAKND